MPLENRKRYPGRPDINAQFTAENIERTLADYKAIRERGGNYKFGALTAKFYHLDESETEAWESDIELAYPKDVQEEIKRHIIHALTHRDDHGHERPIQLTIKWSTGSKQIVATYKPSVPSYTIDIIGFLGPAASLLAARRKKKK